MTTHKSPSQKKGKKDGKKGQDNKKLRKEEKRLQERLQKAQEEQAQAQKRLERAEARLQKRTTQVQRLEERLTRVHERLGIVPEPALASPSEPPSVSQTEEPSVSQPESPSVSTREEPVFTLSAANTAESAPADSSVVFVPPLTAENVPVIESVESLEGAECVLVVESVEDVLVPLESEPSPVVETTSPVSPAQPPSEAMQHAWQARATAEAAEEEARAAVERVHKVAQQLEGRGVCGRHIEQELVQLEAEVERTNLMADEARRAAREAEHQTGELPKLDEEAVVPDDEKQGNGTFIARQEQVWSVEKIAEEEEQLEVGVTRTQAEVAAQAAAEAEALAEASSARARKARIIARQADQELTLVRAAIRHNSLTGKEAEAALQAAERKSTHAHLELDDAEVAEESAIEAARNAEADAEVAEGMALSASDRCIDDVNGQTVQALADQEERKRVISPPLSVEGNGGQYGERGDDMRTEKRPVLRSQWLT